METVSNVASVSTLILFVIYFVGRFYGIIQSKNEINETLEREYSENFKIIDEFDIGTNNCEEIYLIARTTLLNVRVFKCEFSEKTYKVIKGKCICNCGKLRNGFVFKFNSYLAEGIPQYMLEYEANDFTKGRLFFSENAKNGIIDEMIYKKHTLKSVLYYLFK